MELIQLAFRSLVLEEQERLLQVVQERLQQQGLVHRQLQEPQLEQMLRQMSRHSHQHRNHRLRHNHPHRSQCLRRNRRHMSCSQQSYHMNRSLMCRMLSSWNHMIHSLIRKMKRHSLSSLSRKMRSHTKRCRSLNSLSCTLELHSLSSWNRKTNHSLNSCCCMCCNLVCNTAFGSVTGMADNDDQLQQLEPVPTLQRP